MTVTRRFISCVVNINICKCKTHALLNSVITSDILVDNENKTCQTSVVDASYFFQFLNVFVMFYMNIHLSGWACQGDSVNKS